MAHVADIFEQSSYLGFLRALTGGKGQRSGVKSRLAKAMGCHPAFLSRVLAGKAHISLEQADAIVSHLGLGAGERRYFFCLVEEARAGTLPLQKFFRDERAALAKRRLDVRERIPEHQRISAEDQAVYYSAWYYAAIHVLVSVERFQTPEALAQALALPLVTVNEAIAFLRRKGVLRVGRGKILVDSRHVHLDKASPLLRLHHANWRQKAIQSLDRNREDEVRYSAAFSLSRGDAEAIKNKLLTHLKEILETVAKSPEEEAYVFCVDFFNLT